MIRLGLRLCLRGGKESLTRLLVMALAMALGVAMLLATLAIMNATGSQDARGAWLSTLPPIADTVPPGDHHPVTATATATNTNGRLWWLVTTDEFENRIVVRADVAPASTDPVLPPGVPRLPGVGEYYVSPALAALLHTTPADQLRDRFPGRKVGTIEASALPSPNDLVIVVGDSAKTLAGVSGAGVITRFATSSSDGGPDTLGSTGLDILLAVLALVLLFPVLVFVGTATRLSTARREQRFASMRLAGATLRQVAVIAAVEAVIAALAGILIGFALFELVRPALVHVPVSGQPPEPGDLRIGLADTLIVASGVPTAAALMARAALRRVGISPLGVTRRVTPRPPRFFRILPLVAGIGVLVYFLVIGRPSSSNGQIEAYLLGFFLIMVGLVVAGPWLTMVVSRILASRTKRVPLLVAGRRLADNPKGAFRAINGLILAIFVTSVSVGVVSTLLIDHGSMSSGTKASETVTDQFVFNEQQSVPSVPGSVVHALRTTKGVTGVTLVYVAPRSMRTDGTVPNINGLGGQLQYGLVTCASLSTTPALGQCQHHATLAALGDDIGFMPITKSVTTAASVVWPAAHVRQAITTLPVQLVAVATDGSATTIARIETILDAHFPFASQTGLFGEMKAQAAQLLIELKTASEVVILTSLLIAGCSLAVSMASGISERRRPFALLRLTGVPIGVLRRVVALETAAPLVSVAVLSAIVGLVASDLFLRSQLGLTLRLPGIGYYIIILGGLTGSLVVIGSTLSLLERVTRPEDVRTE